MTGMRWNLGVTLNENNGFNVESITVGTGVKSSTTDVLARGIEKAYYVETEALDSQYLQKRLQKQLKKSAELILLFAEKVQEINILNKLDQVWQHFLIIN